MQTPLIAVMWHQEGWYKNEGLEKNPDYAFYADNGGDSYH
jgi:hypothetical protein